MSAPRCWSQPIPGKGIASATIPTDLSIGEREILLAFFRLWLFGEEHASRSRGLERSAAPTETRGDARAPLEGRR